MGLPTVTYDQNQTMVPLEISVWEFLCPIATQALVVLFWWGKIQGADIAWRMVIMYPSLQYPPHYLPDHRLLRVLWGKQKAPGMNLHNRLASINWRFNYFSKFNPGAEALRIDISVLTHYRHVTNQIFSFAFPARYDFSGKLSLSRAIGHSQDTDRTLTWSMLPHPLFTANISAPPSTPRIPFRQFHFTMFYNRFQ